MSLLGCTINIFGIVSVTRFKQWQPSQNLIAGSIAVILCICI